MSNNKKETEQNQQKVMTKYDRKMQKRQEEKEKAAKAHKKDRWIGIVGALIIVGVLISFPITSWIAANSTYITIDDEKITRVEFDYAYQKVLNDYLSSDEYEVLQQYGYDLTGDLSKVEFSEFLTWKDVLEEKAVITLAEKHAMLEMAEEEGYTFDTDQGYQQYLATMQFAANSSEITVDKYLRITYGGYASEKRLEPFVREDLFVQEYYQHLLDIAEPTDEAINTYYEANVDYLDMVDYRILTITADVEDDATFDEIGNAMIAAKAMAENLLETIETGSDIYEDQKQEDLTSSVLAEWLFSADRKPGDTAVLEDDTTYECHAVYFESRHKDDRPTADFRMMIVGIEEGEDLFNEWKAGEATEESFIEMCKEYSWDNLASEGGLSKGAASGIYKGDVDKWLYEEERNPGDATFIKDEELEVTYILYYLNDARPAWENSVIEILASDVVYEQVHAISDNYEVGDPKNKLDYPEGLEAELAALAEEQAAAETAETESTEETTE